MALPEDNQEIILREESPVIASGSAPAGAVHPGAMIEAMLSRPDVDLDKLEKFYELQVRYEDNEARKAFHENMARFHSLCPEITRNRTARFEQKSNPGQYTEYKWADLAHIIKLIKAPMDQCGLSHNFKVEQLEQGQIKVTCYVTHRQGYQIETSMQNSRDDTGSKNNLQSMGSTVEYLKRYTLTALLGLSAGEDDDAMGSEAPPVEIEYVTDQMAQELKTMFEQAGGDAKPILDYFHAEDWSQIPKKDYSRVAAKLQQRILKNLDEQPQMDAVDQKEAAARAQADAEDGIDKDWVDDFEGDK